MDVLGVDLSSTELPGKLLLEELVDLNVVKFIRTLCGLDFSFCGVIERRFDFLGLSAGLVGDVSRFVGGTAEVMGLPVIFDSLADCPSLSVVLPIFRFGDGDLELVIQDFRANVANDSDTVLVLLSRIALEIEGTGGASAGVVSISSDELLRRSGLPLTF